MTEFRIRCSGLKPGSILADGGILLSDRQIATCGVLHFTAPVSVRRWKAYLDGGWQVVSESIDFTTEQVTGMIRKLP